MVKPTVTGKGGNGKTQSGFTLLGLLFIVAGMGVGMAALGTMWHTAAQREREKDLLFVGSQYRQAIASFWEMPVPEGSVRRLPMNFDELLSDPRSITPVRHLRRLYRDPMTGASEWGVLKDPNGGITGVYSLSEEEPFKKTLFPSEYLHFQNATRYQEWRFTFDDWKVVKQPGQETTEKRAQ